MQKCLDVFIQTCCVVLHFYHSTWEIGCRGHTLAGSLVLVQLSCVFLEDRALGYHYRLEVDAGMKPEDGLWDFLLLGVKRQMMRVLDDVPPVLGDEIE